MSVPGTVMVQNETQAEFSRITKGGKRYTYRLHVLQQPARARACGMGAKSSADRRPVDPPPIVELKIFEGYNDLDLKDVTFHMDANYFLFATLEQARHIAPGRGLPDQKNLTVLTGTPVAGMVYLDRPNPAGYFIFPDLSVRHEGKYRLTFGLYEECKHEMDEDRCEPGSSDGASAGVHVTHRLEVRSQPFIVYSAKKFPGLSESTSLSRMVAEQGCRVRIRRDVRMRRRDKKDYQGGFDDDTASMRGRLSVTPEPNYSSMHGPPPRGYTDSTIRPRSSSNASQQSPHSMRPVIPLSRRTSLQDTNQTYGHHPYTNTPHTPTYATTQSFAPPNAIQQQQHQSYVQHQQQQAMGPPPQSHFVSIPYSHSHQFPPHSSSVATAEQQGQYFNPQYQTISSSAHDQSSHLPPPAGLSGAHPNTAQAHRSSVDYTSYATPEHRHSISGHLPMLSSQNNFPNQQDQPFCPQQSYQPPAQYQPQSQHQYQTSPSYTQQPSSHNPVETYSMRPTAAEPMQPPTGPSSIVPPLSGNRRAAERLPSLSTSFSLKNKKIEPASPASLLPHHTNPPTPVDTLKRSHGNVFSDRHLEQPLRQGARPSISGYGSNGMYASELNEEPFDLDSSDYTTIYRRANGLTVRRELPPAE